MLTDDLIVSLHSHAGEAGQVPVGLIDGIERRTVRRHRRRVATAAVGVAAVTVAVVVGASGLGRSSASGRRLPPAATVSTSPTTHHEGAPANNPVPQEVTPGRLSVAATIPVPAADAQHIEPFDTTFAQDPYGAVFYAVGSTVDVVTGDHPPVVAAHAAGPVIAIAASATDLYVATGRTITDYDRASGAATRTWTTDATELPNQAGLFVEGDVLYVWTDRETSRLGFQFATVSRIVTTSAQAEVIDRSVYPADLAADAQGLYFESHRDAPTAGDYLAHIGPSGSVRYAAHPRALDAPITIVDGQVAVDLPGQKTNHELTAFNSTTLEESGTALTTASVEAIDPNAIGAFTIIGRTNACQQAGQCASAQVEGLPLFGDTLTDPLSVPDASYLVPGPDLVVITQHHDTAAVVRLTDHR